MVQFSGSSGIYGFTYLPDKDGQGKAIHLWVDNRELDVTDGYCRADIQKREIHCAAYSIYGATKYVVGIDYKELY
ncbi:hypothetical protein AA0229_1891 [Gluconobacter cerinus NRIC 0229]|uniref:Uncharacterized protein n=1 Tax=Gluconobacter cerinus TaxID=38307 RepID=A0AAV5NAP9_9PROT|nr:hypothetical protein AA0229_1891 [Gluconobacter cerinus NRIC 0229]GLQ61574.1 hypothetical protein GCM10007867_04190 [Gluconobacter cerinus]